MVEVRASDRLPRQIWILVVAAFLIAIGFGIVAPTLPVFVRSFDVDPGVHTRRGGSVAYFDFFLTPACLYGRRRRRCGGRTRWWRWRWRVGFARPPAEAFL